MERISQETKERIMSLADEAAASAGEEGHDYGDLYEAILKELDDLLTSLVKPSAT